MDLNFDNLFNEAAAKVEKEMLASQMKNAAEAMFLLYKSFVEAGFAKVQAMDLVKEIVKASFGQSNKK